MEEKGVSNNSFWRNISNKLDDKVGWDTEKSGARGIVHGVYHDFVGTLKYLSNNPEGAKAEFNRANQQFERGKNLGNSPPRK